MPTQAALLLIILICTFGTSTKAFAWWDLGHGAICSASLNHVRPETRQQIEQLLALNDPNGGFSAESFASACAWADRIKRERRDTADWHYINVPAEFGSIESAGAQTSGRLLTALDQQLHVLSDISEPPLKRAEALRWVGHLVGDLHQPMHVGFASDWGGNKQRIALPDEIKPAIGEQKRDHTNMHALWDGYLLIYASRQAQRSVLAMIEAMPEIDPSNSGTFRDWAEQSLSVVRRHSVAYAHEPKLTTLSESYLQQHSSVAITQLRAAAQRLASVLDQALAPTIR